MDTTAETKNNKSLSDRQEILIAKHGLREKNHIVPTILKPKFSLELHEICRKKDITILPNCLITKFTQTTKNYRKDIGKAK